MTYYLGRSQADHKSLFYELASNAKLIAVDTETVSVQDRRLLGIGVAFNIHDGFYVIEPSEEFDVVVKLLRDKSVRKIYHNAPFDLRVLRYLDVDAFEVEDTSLMARLKPEDSAVLEDLSFWVKEYEYGDMQTEKAGDVVARHGRTMLDVPEAVVAQKCCKDAMAAMALFLKYKGEVSMTYYERLRRLLGPLEAISQQGLLLDQGVLTQLHQGYSQTEARIRALCRSMGFRVSSNFEVGYTMAERGHALPYLPKSGLLQTTDDILCGLNDPLAMAVMQWRAVSKKLSTYIRPWLGEERAYTTLRMEAATGRLNSTNAGKWEKDRNLQNIPKVTDIGRAMTIRSAFIPDNRMFTLADKSQLELRILAHRSQDQHMLDVFAVDGDFHADTSQRMGLPRVRAKNFNFAIPYGADAAVVAKSIGTRDVRMVDEQIRLWYQVYPGAAEYFAEQERFGLENGYVVTTGGRKMRIPWELGEKHGRNCCRNYPIQGTAAEDVFELMNWVVDETDWLEITRLQVHDELIFDGEVELPGMVLNGEESKKEGVSVYDVKGDLAWLSGYYAPIQVKRKERWG